MLALFTAAPRTFAADAVNDHFMALDAESVFGSHFVADRDQLFALKLNQLPTTRAVEVIVLWIAVVVVVDRAAVKLKTIEQARVDTLAECSVHRRGADVVGFASARKPFDQFLGVEMIVLAEDLANQELALIGLPEAARLQVLRKPLLR